MVNTMKQKQEARVALDALHKSLYRLYLHTFSYVFNTFVKKKILEDAIYVLFWVIGLFLLQCWAWQNMFSILTN